MVRPIVHVTDDDAGLRESFRLILDEVNAVLGGVPARPLGERLTVARPGPKVLPGLR